MTALLRRSWLKQTLMQHLKADAPNTFQMTADGQYLTSVEDWPVMKHAQLIAYLSQDEPPEDSKQGIVVELSDKYHFVQAELTREAIWWHEQSSSLFFDASPFEGDKDSADLTNPLNTDRAKRRRSARSG